MQAFAVVVGSLSAFTSVLYFIPFILRFMVTVIWNFCLLILWITVFGLFGNVSILVLSQASLLVSAWAQFMTLTPIPCPDVHP